VSVALAAPACTDEKSESGAATADAVPDSPAGVDTARVTLDETRCYRSPHSVLLGPRVAQRNNGHPPGWIRLDSIRTQPEGPAQLVDATRAGLGAQWHRQGGDSLRIAAADDFLRVELLVSLRPDSLHGRATAFSDADVERDSADQLGPVRRSWELRAVRASCDSMPRTSLPS